MSDRLKRLYKIPQMIYFEEVNQKDIANEFDVNRRTIGRDLNFLKEEIGLPINFNRSKNCYEFYKKDKLKLIEIIFDWLSEKKRNYKFKDPYFITNHAIKQFQSKIYFLRPAEIIFLLQYWLQEGQPFEFYKYKNKPTWTYRRTFVDKPVYIPVTVNLEDEWPVVPTIHGEESKVHGKYIKGGFENAKPKKAN